MKKHITLKQAEALGVTPLFEEMPNKEKRFRLISKDGSSYCRTEASSTGAWQNSHFHKEMTELYIVQTGSVLFAKQVDGRFSIEQLLSGDTITIPPYCPHNLYLNANAVIHTIKYGEASSGDEPDWFASHELDQWISQQ